MADDTLATVLDAGVGTLLLHVEQDDVDVAGRRVMPSREWHVPERATGMRFVICKP